MSNTEKMSKDKVMLDAQGVVDLYKGIGKTPKQLGSLTFEVTETPLEGTISDLVRTPKVYTPKGGKPQKYFVYSVVDADGKEIGEISVNRLFDTQVKEDDVVIVANDDSPNKGMAMLRSHRLSNTSKLGKSRAEQIANAIGKSYKATRKEGFVITSYDAKDMFVEPDKDGKVGAKALRKLWENTSVSDRLMEIVIG